MLKKRYKAPVTIVVGIKCKESTIVACDSRTTQMSGHIDDRANKLHEIEFQDGNIGLVAVAGNDDLSSRAVEIIKTKARSKNLENYRSLADCAEQAVVELKRDRREQYVGTAEELQKHFSEYSFELMIAHYFNGQPFIFTLQFELGSAIKRDRLYWSIGHGSTMADFFISRLDVSQFRIFHAIWIAAYAIEEIKRFDASCGGKTKFAVSEFSNGRSRVSLFADEFTDRLNTRASTFADFAKSQWIKTAEDHMREGEAKYQESKGIKKPSTSSAADKSTSS